MNEKEIKRISKFLSLILRHKPEKIGLTLDEKGWANVQELISKSRVKNIVFNEIDLEEAVANNNKKRFTFNADKTMIRANQGHSLKTIDLGLEPVEPPAFLYHGTVDKFINSIKRTGLEKRNRQHVHLSKDRATAVNVGSRRGKPVILSVQSASMYQAGYNFYCSKNGVWLTDHVPVEYIDFN